MTTEPRQLLLDALESCQLLLDALESRQTISRYTDGIDFAWYLRAGEKRDAVERRLGIVGEALHRAAALDPALAEQLPELRQIVGLRNRVIHGYADVNAEIIWDVVQNKLPSLQARLADLLKEEAPQERQAPG